MREVTEQVLFWLGIILVFVSFLLQPNLTPIFVLVGLFFAVTAFFSGMKQAKKGLFHHMTMLKIQRLMLVIVFLVTLIFFLLVQGRLLTDQEVPFWFYMLLGVNGLFVIFLIIIVIRIFAKRRGMFLSYSGMENMEKMLDRFIHEALKKGYSYNKIKQSAEHAGWPEQMFDIHFEAIKSDDPEYVIEKLIRNYKLEILKKYVKKALASRYKEEEIKSAALNMHWPLQLVNQAIDEVRHVKPSTTDEEVLEQIAETPDEQPIIKLELVDYETDFDKLYKMVKERGRMKISDIAAAFNISKTQAQYWAKILSDHKLLITYYPAIGEAELRWKK